MSERLAATHGFKELPGGSTAPADVKLPADSITVSLALIDTKPVEVQDEDGGRGPERGGGSDFRYGVQECNDKLFLLLRRTTGSAARPQRRDDLHVSSQTCCYFYTSCCLSAERLSHFFSPPRNPVRQADESNKKKSHLTLFLQDAIGNLLVDGGDDGFSLVL